MKVGEIERGGREKERKRGKEKEKQDETDNGGRENERKIEEKGAITSLAH